MEYTQLLHINTIDSMHYVSVVKSVEKMSTKHESSLESLVGLLPQVLHAYITM